MGILKILVLWMLLATAIAEIGSENGATEVHADVAEADISDSSLKFEIEQLKSKISLLEAAILEKGRELKNKEDNIAQLGREIQKKSVSVASLQSEVDLLQKKGAVDTEKAYAHASELQKTIEKLKNEAEAQNRQRNVLETRAMEADKRVRELNLKLESKKGAAEAEELVGRAHARSNELEKKVETLKSEIEEQNKQRNALEARALEAEKKVQELDVKLENLEKTNAEQKRKIQKTEHAIQVAQEELMRARLEVTSKLKELKEVHGAWLPPWLIYHVDRCQEIVAHHWTEHGEPIFNVIVQKASERLSRVQKLIEPHLETAKTKWIPIVKEKWVSFTTIIRPHIEKVSTRTVELIEVCRSAATPHIVKLQEFSGPYIKEARKISKPYIEQVAKVTKPHVEKARIFLKPYTKRVVYGYGKFLEVSKTFHYQIQETVQQNLKKYEFTKHLATKELIWFVASASLALPIFLLYSLLSSIFSSKKAAKPVRGSRSHNHHHRRHKRRHADQ